MKVLDRYIAGTEVISIAQAANFLADRLNSGGERDVLYRRYFRAVERARKSGAFGESNPNRRIRAGDFFVWAQNKYALDCSDNISQVSVSVEIKVTGVDAHTSVGEDATVHSLPSSPKNREREAFRRLHEAELTRRKLLQAEQRIKVLENEKAERSANARANGSLGGRPKER